MLASRTGPQAPWPHAPSRAFVARRQAEFVSLWNLELGTWIGSFFACFCDKIKDNFVISAMLVYECPTRAGLMWRGYMVGITKLC
jgi:hypothetical protein